MAVDFEKMRVEVLADVEEGSEEEKKILADIEKVKLMSEEKIEEISHGLDDAIREQARDEVSESSDGDDAVQFATKKLLAIYLKDHPNESSDDYNEEGFEDFSSSHTEEYNAALDEAIWNEELFDNDVLDEIKRDNTRQIAEGVGLHPRIVVFINPFGLLP